MHLGVSDLCKSCRDPALEASELLTLADATNTYAAAAAAATATAWGYTIHAAADREPIVFGLQWNATWL